MPAPVRGWGEYASETLHRRAPGIDNGKVIIAPDFDARLPEFDA